MSERKPSVLVIGDVMLDIVTAPERPIELGTDTPSAISLLPGGSGANQAAWLGHFGNTVRFAGRVGADGAVEHAAALRACGVEPFFARDERARTGVLVTLVDAQGERSFLTDRGANARLSLEDLPQTLLADVDHVHVSGYAMFVAGPRAAVRELLAAAHARAIPFSIDSGSSAIVREIGSATFFDATRAAAICFSNATEAAILTGTSERGKQLETLAKHYETVVITCGAAGACAATRFGAQCHFAETAAITPLDTSGAGDAFLAGFLSAHLRGESSERCLQAGVGAGSSAVRHYGGRPNVPSHAAAFATHLATKGVGADGR